MESVSFSNYVHLYVLVINNAKNILSFLFIEVVVQVKTKGDLDCFRRVCISHHLTETLPFNPHQFFPDVLKECSFIRVSKDEERMDLQQFLSASNGLKATAIIIKFLMLL